MEEELILYRAQVAAAAEARTGTLLFNGSPAHAQIVAEQLFRSAVQTAHIFSEKLSNEVFGAPGTMDAATKFLAAGGRIYAIVDLNPADELDADRNEFVKRFGDRGLVDIRKVHPKHHETVPYHFFVADKESYRYEPDKKHRVAVVAFNETNGASKLITAFDALWASASPLKVPA